MPKLFSVTHNFRYGALFVITDSDEKPTKKEIIELLELTFDFNDDWLKVQELPFTHIQITDAKA